MNTAAVPAGKGCTHLVDIARCGNFDVFPFGCGREKGGFLLMQHDACRIPEDDSALCFASSCIQSMDCCGLGPMLSFLGASGGALRNVTATIGIAAVAV